MMRIFLLAAASLTLATAAPAAGPLAQEHSVVYHNENRESYVEGPGLVLLADGAFVAIVPVVPRDEWKERRVGGSTIHILRSEDAGKTWKEASQLPYYSAVPWEYEGVLYLFANKPGAKIRNDDLLLLRSLDGGKTWSDPVTLFKGHFWNCHTGIVIRDRTLYWAVDDLSGGNAKRGPLAIAGDLSRDPMDPKSWRRSETVEFPGMPDELTNAEFKNLGSFYLEPNVIDVNGRLRVLSAVKPQRQSTAGLCAVFDLEDKDGALELKFVQYSPMPGGQLKFCIVWDDVSRMFWATANIPVDSQNQFPWWEDVIKEGVFKGPSGGNDRRLLMLLYSLDGLNWFQAGCIAQAGKLSQSFMYARPVIDGNDLAIICRTSVDAPNQHDADYATFHRVTDFRSLALDLRPRPEKAP